MKHVKSVQKIKVGTQGHKIFALSLSETTSSKIADRRAKSEKRTARSQERRAKSEERRAKSQEPRAKSVEPGAKSEEPRARSEERIAKSEEPDCDFKGPAVILKYGDVENIAAIRNLLGNNNSETNKYRGNK